MLQLQMDEEQYRIVDGDEEGELVDYGEIATLVTEDAEYVTLVRDPNNEAEFKVYDLDLTRLEAVPAEVVDVEIEVEVEGEDEPPE